MFDKVTLEIRGDLNPLKKRLLENPSCSSSVAFSGSRKKDSIHSVEFDSQNDLFALDQFLNVLVEYILERYEMSKMEHLLREEYPSLPLAGRREMLRCVKQFEDDCEIGREVRKQAILLSLYDYLRDNSEMLLEGFVTFRLREYESLLERLVERVAEACMTQREYEDFIGLLKYFVNLQENRPHLTHLVVVADGSYALLSEAGENITERCLAEFTEEDEIPEVADFDDLLISMLITLAPRNILLHNAEAFRNKELLNTMQRVFDGHFLCCKGCDLCRMWQAKKNQHTKA